MVMVGLTAVGPYSIIYLFPVDCPVDTFSQSHPAEYMSVSVNVRVSILN